MAHSSRSDGMPSSSSPPLLLFLFIRFLLLLLLFWLLAAATLSSRVYAHFRHHYRVVFFPSVISYSVSVAARESNSNGDFIFKVTLFCQKWFYFLRCDAFFLLISIRSTSSISVHFFIIIIIVMVFVLQNVLYPVLCDSHTCSTMIHLVTDCKHTKNHLLALFHSLPLSFPQFALDFLFCFPGILVAQTERSRLHFIFAFSAE